MIKMYGCFFIVTDTVMLPLVSFAFNLLFVVC